ncbi:MAG TPA: lysophospholipase [Nanoarchaeota archaeon]|nr:lysophospholipase [Nanoarchaeota archaeon]HIH51074.1 lysophospholipase [Nanoarchaeota archaeon]
MEPIVKVRTKDKLPLYGLLLESKKGSKKALFIELHGTASNFYENEFMWPLAQELGKQGISTLVVNTRGADSLQAYPFRGNALEKFEDCVLDIDAWVEFVLKKGYKKIILSGHSLGTQKVIYYMEKGKYARKVASVILLAFADSYAYHNYFVEKTAKKEIILREAKKLVNEGKGDTMLRSVWLAHRDRFPKSAASYLSFFGEGSELSKALPLRNKGKLSMYSKIKVPILAVIGDREEYTAISIKESLFLLKKENKLAEAHQIKNCDHDFTGKERELAKIIVGFLKRKL